MIGKSLVVNESHPEALVVLMIYFYFTWSLSQNLSKAEKDPSTFLVPFPPKLSCSLRPSGVQCPCPPLRLSPPLASFSEKRRLEDRWRRDRTFFCHGEVQKCRLIGAERSRSFCQYLFWSWLNQEFSYLYLCIFL